MTEIYDYLVDFTEKTDIISYDFYEKYLGSNVFREKFESRLAYIKQKYSLDMTEDEMIKEYFVEIFSWSVLNRSTLLELVKFVRERGIRYMIDPCCGNGFHNFLFENYSSMDILTADIQDEPCSWTPMKEIDGRDFIEGMNDKHHEEGALILSWINGEDLALQLLNRFRGNMIISIGNYVFESNYIRSLNYDFNLNMRIVLKMPWGLEEKIEIYTKKY